MLFITGPQYNEINPSSCQGWVYRNISSAKRDYRHIVTKMRIASFGSSVTLLWFMCVSELTQINNEKISRSAVLHSFHPYLEIWACNLCHADRRHKHLKPKRDRWGLDPFKWGAKKDCVSTTAQRCPDRRYKIGQIQCLVLGRSHRLRTRHRLGKQAGYRRSRWARALGAEGSRERHGKVM